MAANAAAGLLHCTGVFNQLDLVLPLTEGDGIAVNDLLALKDSVPVTGDDLRQYDHQVEQEAQLVSALVVEHQLMSTS